MGMPPGCRGRRDGPLPGRSLGDEFRRADGFHHERDRKWYTAVHGMLKEILADLLDRVPRTLRFLRGDPGRLYLPDEDDLLNR